MAFSDTSESVLSIIAESTFNTTPSSPTFLNLLITNENLSLQMRKEIDPSVRGRPQVSAKKRLGQQVSGQIAGILRFGAETDLLLEWALRSSFAALVLKGGSTAKSLTIERKHVAGATSNYFRFTGVRCQQIQFSTQAEGFVTWQADVIGMAHSVGTSILTNATYTAPSNPDKPMAAPDLASFTVDGLGTQPSLRSLNLTINNNAAVQPKIGSVSPAGVRYGDQNVTGSLEAYFEDLDLYNKFLNQSVADISWSFGDGTNTYVFDMPNCTPDEAAVPIGGNNQDAIKSFGFESLYDSSATTSLSITKSS